MSDLSPLLDPGSIAIAGLSSDESKHGGRVLTHLRRHGFGGPIRGVNPRLPRVDGVDMYGSIGELPEPPDLVVAAVPAAAAVEVVAQCSGVGAVVVFGAGFAESGPEGAVLQAELAHAAAAAGTRVLGPNSGGLIRPDRGLTASFLTCLDRPGDQIRSGAVAVVTQSGGTGSYIHNLAAQRGDGLAVSVATGNEVDIALGEAVDAVSRLDEVRVVLAIVETLRDGAAFIEAVRTAHDRGIRVVVCRLGTGVRARSLMTSHTGALAVSSAILDGVLDALGVVTAETPGEAYEVATLLAGAPVALGRRVGIVTHSGGAAILLADIAERTGLELPSPGEELQAAVAPLLDHGTADNPLDMGGIITGPARFAQAVDLLARSREFDVVVAVSTAHPPAHTPRRVEALVGLDRDFPVINLWMAGDQATDGLTALRREGVPVTEEPRAAMRAARGLVASTADQEHLAPIRGPVETWGIPLDRGALVSSAAEATKAATEIGFPVVVKAEAPGLSHRTDIGGVRLDLRGTADVERAFTDVVGAARAAGRQAASARVQRYRPGLEVIVGALVHPSLGPLVSVGMGGVFAELIGDVVFAPAPVGTTRALSMIGRLRSRPVLDGFRGLPPADVGELARIVSTMSRGILGSGVREIEVNPLIWGGDGWMGVDLMVAGETEAVAG